MSRLAEEIKRLREESKSEFLKLKDQETVVVKLDLNEDGTVKGDIFERTYKDKKSKAVKFPVTIVNTGERKMLGLALKWLKVWPMQSNVSSKMWWRSHATVKIRTLAIISK